LKLPLAEVKIILDDKEKELKDYIQKRNQSLTNVYKKLEEDAKELLHEAHEFSVDFLTETIVRLEKEIRKLRLILAQSNASTIVDFTVDNEKISLQEALYLIKQYRNELPTLLSMGEYKTRSRLVDPTSRYATANTVDRSYTEITEPTFDTKKYRELAKKTEFLIRKLEVAINQGNYSTLVEVDFISED